VDLQQLFYLHCISLSSQLSLTVLGPANGYKTVELGRSENSKPRSRFECDNEKGEQNYMEKTPILTLKSFSDASVFPAGDQSHFVECETKCKVLAF